VEKVISDDYMAVNFQGKVSDKENEIATAKAGPKWISMTVFNAKVRFLTALVKSDRSWQLVATQSTSFQADSSQLVHRQ
jgi:hypothetical protein